MSEAGVSTHSAMEGGGFYNRHSALQESAIHQVMPLWRSVVEKTPARSDSFVLADYASSQGKNSLPPINQALDQILQRSPTPASLEVIHTDLPSNDFSSLFAMLETDPDSYLRRDARISALAVGRSYFQTILPPGTVDLAWNSWSLQWMSKLPQPIKDGVFIDCSKDASTRQAFAFQLRADWETFLTCRSAELAVGGRLFSMFVADRPDLTGWRPFWGALWSVLEEMKNEGKLSAGQLDAISLPVGARTITDLEAPFGAGKVFANLRIEHIEMIDGPDPFWDAWVKTGDAGDFGWSWANMARAVVGPIVSQALAEDPAGDGRQNEIFERFAKTLASDPQRVAHCLAVIVLGKI
jgi:hypothetical protein